MACVHLQQLFKLCQEHDLQIGGAEVIRVVCNQCGEQEVCPSMLSAEYDARHLEQDAEKLAKASSQSDEAKGS